MKPDKPSDRRQARLRNWFLAGIAALTGLVALIIVLVALLAGLWLDSLLGQRGPATICLLVLSVPITLFVMVRVALGLVRKLQTWPIALNEPLSQEKEE